jgi:hypothetical protein
VCAPTFRAEEELFVEALLAVPESERAQVLAALVALASMAARREN